MQLNTPNKTPISDLEAKEPMLRLLVATAVEEIPFTSPNCDQVNPTSTQPR